MDYFLVSERDPDNDQYTELAMFSTIEKAMDACRRYMPSAMEFATPENTKVVAVYRIKTSVHSLPTTVLTVTKIAMDPTELKYPY